MKNTFLILLASGLSVCTWAQQAAITLDVQNKGISISPVHHGIFFEDINHAADGGLYAELIRNRSFEDAATPEYWTVVKDVSASLTASLVNTDLLNTAQSQALCLKIFSATATYRAGISNAGFWGMNVVDGREYALSFFAKCDTLFKGNVTATLESTDGTRTYAKAVIPNLSTGWEKYTCKLTASGNDKAARLVLSFHAKGTVYLDVVSLFPPTFNNRKNGLRPDLAQLLLDMKPKFVRFPGGCFIEGDVLANRFQWKKSIGPIEERPGHNNLWGYRTSDGMGFDEFLQLSEDIGAEPLFVVNVGIAHNDFVTGNDLKPYIQDALDAIEYANGAVTTVYGALRASNGHPEPYGLKYMEIGNENYYSPYYSAAYCQFYDSIKAHYPAMKLIGDVAAWGTDSPTWDIPKTADLVDEHYYRNPAWFINEYAKYDSYSRTGPGIYVGEYAVTSGCGLGNLSAAIGEAVYMAGMENNADVVKMSSYAPIFVHVKDRAWSPDMIDYNASDVYCTPSYYVQKLFSNNIGNVLIPVSDSSNVCQHPIIGQIGLGTWNTLASFDNAKLTKSDGSTLFSDDFSNSTNWTASSGTWAAGSGVYAQTQNATDCRSIASTSVADTAYTYSLKAKKDSGNEGFLIIFGYQDTNNFYWWNIGGWGNTQHAIEQCVAGSKTTVASAKGSIITGKWYNIRIEVTGTNVKCYLDDVLIHELNTSTKLFYTTASLDEASKTLFIKVINPNNADVTAGIHLKGLSGSLDGELSVLTSDNVTDENSLDSPLNVIPVTSTMHADVSLFKQTFKANSVNILKLDLSKLTTIDSKKSGGSSIKLCPNPVKDIVRFTGLKESPLWMELYTMTGISILKKSITADQCLDVSCLPPGLYSVHLKGNDFTQTAKLLKE